MNFLELAKKRYSVRSYKDQKVEKNKVDLILEAGNVAPTGANKQPYHIIVVQSDEGLLKLKKTANVYGAPLALIVCAAADDAWTRSVDSKNIVEIDSTIVTDHMMLQATDLGLGSLWVCYFDPQVIRSEFSIPDYLEPLNILGIGYADGAPLSPDRHSGTRKSLNQTVSYEVF